MPTEDPDQPTTDELPDDAPLDQVRAALKRERDRNKATRAEAEAGRQAQRELAYMKAGVDITSPLGQLFMRGDSGELDPDAIKTRWSEVAPAPAATPPPAGEATTPPPEGEQTGLTDEQREQLRRDREALNSNPTPPGQEPTTPVGQAMMDAAFEAGGGARARPQGGMTDRQLNAGFAVLFDRANKGDPDALFKGAEEHIRPATERWRSRNA